MTTKATEKPVLRLVNGQSFNELVVGVTDHELEIRMKGRRGTSTVRAPWGWVYQKIVQYTLAEEKDKAKPNRARKAPRGLLRRRR